MKRHWVWIFRTLDGVLAAWWALLSVGAYYGGSPFWVVICAALSLYATADCVMGYQELGTWIVPAETSALPNLRPGILFVGDGKVYIVTAVFSDRVFVRRPQWNERLWWRLTGRKIPEGVA